MEIVKLPDVSDRLQAMAVDAQRAPAARPRQPHRCGDAAWTAIARSANVKLD